MLCRINTIREFLIGEGGAKSACASTVISLQSLFAEIVAGSTGVGFAPTFCFGRMKGRDGKFVDP